MTIWPNYSSNLPTLFVFAHFLSIWHEKDIIQQLKAWSFRMWKNLVHTQSNSDTIARWSSITFFLYTLYSKLFNIVLILIIILNRNELIYMYKNLNNCTILTSLQTICSSVSVFIDKMDDLMVLCTLKIGPVQWPISCKQKFLMMQ